MAILPFLEIFIIIKILSPFKNPSIFSNIYYFWKFYPHLAILPFLEISTIFRNFIPIWKYYHLWKFLLFLEIIPPFGNITIFGNFIPIWQYCHFWKFYLHLAIFPICYFPFWKLPGPTPPQQRGISVGQVRWNCTLQGMKGSWNSEWV